MDEEDRSGSTPTDQVSDSDGDWAWRARIRSDPRSHRIYRLVVGVIGMFIVVVGLLAVPLPGPGWLIVFVGLAVLASEFERAQRLRDFTKRHVRNWTAWAQAQSLLVRAALGLATAALVAALVWTYLALAGIPTWLPGAVQDTLVATVPGLST